MEVSSYGYQDIYACAMDQFKQHLCFYPYTKVERLGFHFIGALALGQVRQLDSPEDGVGMYFNKTVL